MLPDRVSNPGPLTYESDALPIALRGPADRSDIIPHPNYLSSNLAPTDEIRKSRHKWTPFWPDTKAAVKDSASTRRAVISYWRKYVHEVLVTS